MVIDRDFFAKNPQYFYSGDAKKKRKTLYSEDAKYTSFSGCDIVPAILIPGAAPIFLGSVQTVSYSIHRETYPARSLGRSNPNGFAKGDRTIAGTIIFTVFNNNISKQLLDGINSSSEFSEAKKKMAKKRILLMDEMPMFDLLLFFNNEYGEKSYIEIKGITISDEGQVMSIQNLLTENTYSYMAKDIITLNSEVDDKILEKKIREFEEIKDAYADSAPEGGNISWL